MASLNCAWATRYCDLEAPPGHRLAEALRPPIETLEDYQRLGVALERYSSYSPSLSEQGLGPEWAPVLTDRGVEAAAWQVWRHVNERRSQGFKTPVSTLLYCPRTANGWDRSRFERLEGHPDPSSGQVDLAAVAWPFAGATRQSVLIAQDLFWDPLPVPLMLNQIGAAMKVEVGGAIGLTVPSANTWDEVCIKLFGATSTSSRLDRELPSSPSRPKARF